MCVWGRAGICMEFQLSLHLTRYTRLACRGGGYHGSVPDLRGARGVASKHTYLTNLRVEWVLYGSTLVHQVHGDVKRAVLVPSPGRIRGQKCDISPFSSRDTPEHLESECGSFISFHSSMSKKGQRRGTERSRFKKCGSEPQAIKLRQQLVLRFLHFPFFLPPFPPASPGQTNTHIHTLILEYRKRSSFDALIREASFCAVAAAAAAVVTALATVTISVDSRSASSIASLLALNS